VAFAGAAVPALVAAPATVEQEANTDNTLVKVFDEQQGVALAAPLAYDQLTTLSDSGSIPTGTVVDSHYVHFDNTGTAPGRRGVGEISFACPVLGLITQDTNLAASDSILGAIGTAYPVGLSFRGLEQGTGGVGDYPSRDWTLQDIISLSDADTLFVDLQVFNVLDQLRVVTTAAQATVVDLIAGQHYDVGDITVWFDEGTLFVKLQTADGWLMAESHVAVADDLAGIPQTKKGNPIPGQFPYSETHNPWTDSFTYEIPWDGGDWPFIAAHAALYQIDSEGPFWASNVVADDQHLRKDGTPVLAGRSDPNEALGVADASTTPVSGFYSLGFGGSITVEFDAPIWNSPDPNEFAGVEITGGSSYPLETASVEFYYDGSWHLATTALTNQPVNGGDPKTTTYVEIPAGIPYAEMVRITDTSNPTPFEPTADGFDLDAVKALHLVVGSETGWGDGDDFPGRNWATYFEHHRCSEVGNG
jgi:hypothetical protein